MATPSPAPSDVVVVVTVPVAVDARGEIHSIVLAGGADTIARILAPADASPPSRRGADVPTM